MPQTVKADGPSDKKKGKEKGGKRFEIKKWNAVAMWSWAICTDTCAICRNNLYEPSIEYQANPTGKRPGRSAAVAQDRLPKSVPCVGSEHLVKSLDTISTRTAFTGHVKSVSCRNDTLQL